MCVSGDQLQDGVDLSPSDYYLPVVKAAEAQLKAAITADYACLLLKSDTLPRNHSQGPSLERSGGCRGPPKWCPTLVSEFHVFQVKIPTTKQSRMIRFFHEL